jgi:DNA-binding response OmpR family regulator
VYVTAQSHSHAWAVRSKLPKKVKMQTEMSPAARAILIVDDDEEVRQTLSAILQSQGYQVANAANANEAVKKVRAQFFDLILLDIKLPDMEGTQLLLHFQNIAPETLKIIITGNPSLRTATEALNIGANSYLTKPIDPDLLLKTIERKLTEHDQQERITGKRLTEWVKLRLRKTQSSEFEEFLERSAATLASFDMSKTQARIYVGLNALGVASASEIASLTGIRREEVYRTMPELEKRGLITRRFGSPRRFTAIKPSIALKILVKTRIKDMKEEASKLKNKKDELISQLEKTTYGIHQEEESIEALSQQDNVLAKITEMTKKAKQQIVLASSFDQLETMFLRKIIKIARTATNQIMMRIIIGGPEPGHPRELDDVHTLRIFRLPQIGEKKIDLRRVRALPFNLLMVDNEQAIWGEFQPADANRRILWTNDLTQIAILKMAFENLWLESEGIDGSLNSVVDEQKAL